MRWRLVTQPCRPPGTGAWPCWGHKDTDTRTLGDREGGVDCPARGPHPIPKTPPHPKSQRQPGGDGWFIYGGESQCSLTGPSHGGSRLTPSAAAVGAEVGGGGLRPVLAGPCPVSVAAHGLGHDQPQQDQDPGPQGQAHHVAPGVIWKGQEGTVTGGPWEEPPGAPRPKESHGGDRGRKGMEGVEMGLPGQTDTPASGHAGELLA